ncbi:hypothetical protein PQJ75_00590 [Rhodoplanes sp. TEM]|uniref:Uncharacterized protein n=1 Tax=Rhodoplanes tepidamans TaxID=200616 RepID=A0ABT5J539_RHOTP|nr:MULTISPECIES: hypothetical protein [Rhodoplanes]MDC7784749.1 hypothetical protein [Rhodoplanes tepidamans]MDC7982216.1 hypothetical protein [Rhodoplanes sp. TEM]MDQ0356222.1 hypothetical protein [Rhodoplanes tepidamans]
MIKTFGLIEEAHAIALEDQLRRQGIEADRFPLNNEEGERIAWRVVWTPLPRPQPHGGRNGPVA